MAQNTITSSVPVSAGSKTTTATVLEETAYYTSKYGRVAIFNGDNYAQFSTTCRFALTACGAWTITQGTEEIPAEGNTAAAVKARSDYNERLNRGIQIVSSSVTEAYINRLIPYLDTSDLPGMWTELAKADRAKDDVYVITARYQFAHERFNRHKETIRQFAMRLDQYKTKLAGSSKPITDEEILNQIIFNLPADGPNWQMAKQFIIRDKQDLEQALNTLQSYESDYQADTAGAAMADTAAAAYESGGHSRGRGGKRGRGRSRGRGGSHHRFDGSRGSSSRRGGYRSGSAGGGKKNSKCFFCGKNGHWQADCQKYKKAQQNTKGRDDEEAANVVFNSNEDGTLYYASTAERAHFIAAIIDWILDSGATRHFTGVQSDIQSLKRWSTPKVVRIADQRKAHAIGYGTAVVAGMKLEEVWFVPEFGSIRMVSVNKLNDAGISVLFEKGVATGLRDKKEIFKAPRSSGLFLIDGGQKAYTATEIETMSEAEVWHRRLAHTNYRDLERLLPVQKGMKLGKRVIPKGDHACEACLAGKMKESFTKKTDSRSETVLRRLHADISGILPPSLRQYRYFLLVVDDATRVVWVRFMKSKETAEVLPIIEQLKAEVERETGNEVVYFRVDNGRGEFGAEFKERMRLLGIQVEPSPPYKHSLNGVVERMMGSVTVKARSMLQQAKLDTEFWCYAVEHAVWVKNRVPTAALPYGSKEMSKAVTPFEAYKKAHPDLTRLKVFGCAAFPINTLEKFPKKWEPRSKTGYIMIGMKGSAVWKLLNCKTFKVEEYADVQFDEYKFPAPTINREESQEPVVGSSRRECRPDRAVENTSSRSNPADGGVTTHRTLQQNDRGVVSSPVEGRPVEDNPVEDLGTNAEQQSVARRGKKTAKPKVWQYFEKTRGFVPLPLPVTESRLRTRPRPQNEATVADLANDEEKLTFSSPEVCRCIPCGPTQAASAGSCGAGSRHREVCECSHCGLTLAATSGSVPGSPMKKHPQSVGCVECKDDKGSRRPMLPLVRVAPLERGRAVQWFGAGQVDHSLRRQMRQEQRVFSHPVTQAVVSYNAVHLDAESSSLGAPVAPFEAITLEEALAEDALNWKSAIAVELRALETMNTFKILKGNTDRLKVISSRWVLRKKFRADGTIARRKARLVIRGFEQTYGVDYFATFASVIRYTTLRLLLAKAAADDLEAHHIDVNTAFLNPTLEEDVYMEVPDFFEMIHPEVRDQQNVYLKLNKALYGLKQAPRAWQKMVQAFFESIGLTASTADPSLYVGLEVYILLFVDDMLIIGRRSPVEAIKQQILKEWKSKDLGPVDTFVGFQIKRNRSKRTLHIHQTLYTSKLLERLKMHQCHPTVLPLPAATVLKPDESLLDKDEASLYRQIVGSALYLANNTRLDIAYAVGQLARFMSQPAEAHLRHAKQLLRYLNGTRTLGITYSNRLREGPHSYRLYSDATWGTEDDRVSFQGWAVVRYGGAVSWAAQRQKSTALSSMEAEIMAASEGAKEAAWMEKLLVDFGERETAGGEAYIPSLYCDNQGAIDLMHDPKFHAKAKHIDLRNMYIRNDMVSKNRLRVEYIPGTEQPADILTKQLSADTYQRHCATLGMASQ